MTSSFYCNYLLCKESWVSFSLWTRWRYSPSFKDRFPLQSFLWLYIQSSYFPSSPFSPCQSQTLLNPRIEFPVSAQLKEQLRVCESWFEICILTRHISLGDTQIWAVMLYHSKCSSYRPPSTLGEIKQRSRLIHFLEHSVHSSHMTSFCFGIKQYDLFYQSLCLLNLVWFWKYPRILRSFWKAIISKGWDVDILLVPVSFHPYVANFLFFKSYYQRVKAGPYTGHLNLRISPYEVLLLCLLAVSNCLFFF